jgi:hypothetical protein
LIDFKVPLIEGISKPRRPPTKIMPGASQSMDREIVAPAPLPVKQNKHTEAMETIRLNLANAAAGADGAGDGRDVPSVSTSSEVSTLDMGRSIKSIPSETNGLVLPNVDDIHNQIFFTEGLSNIDLLNSDLPPVDRYNYAFHDRIIVGADRFVCSLLVMTMMMAMIQGQLRTMGGVCRRQ